MPFGSGRPRRLTHGAWSDTAPRFSPDGRSLAFLSDREKAGVSQLLVLPLDGGDARPLTPVHDQKASGFAVSEAPRLRRSSLSVRVCSG